MVWSAGGAGIFPSSLLTQTRSVTCDVSLPIKIVLCVFVFVQLNAYEVGSFLFVFRETSKDDEELIPIG